MLLNNQIQTLLNKQIDNKNCFGLTLTLDIDGDGFSYSAGNINVDDQYFIASTTKLFTTSLIFQLIDENKLKITDNISKFLSDEILNKIHIYKSNDYSKNITIQNLLSQTSGLPDYFEGKINGKSLLDDLTKNIDCQWTFEDAINISKTMKTKFPPSQNKAFYSDTNYQLLGKIIENILSDDIATMFNKRIFNKLNLSNTYLYNDINDKRPINLYFKDKLIHIPQAMASFKPDGGIVSTSIDSNIFLKAFFEKKLFNTDLLSFDHKWNRVMFPLEYGLGIMRFKLPRILSPKFKSIELLGHSGLSGAFAFYNPQKKTYLSGTVNQISNPGQSFRLMLKVLNLI